MRFSVYQVSRKGGREKNEDRMGYCYTRDAGLFALADGMGGHPEGEVASQLALQTLAAMFQRDCKPTLADPLRFLHEAIVSGHHQLLRYATQKALIDTPRTTIVACLLQGNAAYWAHCGDSRLYMVRGDKLIARTRDHSYSELQQTMSQVVPMGDRFNRNVLFTCLGSPGKPVVDTVGPLLMQAGDRLLLCSDGLWGTVSDSEITDQLVGLPLSDSVPELVEQALRNGGAEVRQRLGAGGRVGGRREATAATASRPTRSARRCSPRRSRRACSAPTSRPTSSTMPRSSARSRKSTKRSSGRRSRRRADALLASTLAFARCAATGLLPPRFAPLPPRGRGGRRWRPFLSGDNRR